MKKKALKVVVRTMREKAEKMLTELKKCPYGICRQVK